MSRYARSVFFEVPDDLKYHKTMLQKTCKAFLWSRQTGILPLCYGLLSFVLCVYGYRFISRFTDNNCRGSQPPTAPKIDKAATDSDDCSSEQSSPGHRATTSRARRHDKKKRR